MTCFSSLAKGTAVALAICLSAGAAAAQNLMGVNVIAPGDSNVSSKIVLGLNKSTVIELERPAADLVITNPTIADAVVQTAKRIIFRGVEVGQTNAFVFDSNGNQLLNLEIAVEMDTARLDDLIARYVPDARVQVETVNGTVVLNGVVDNVVQSDQVVRLVTAYMAQEGDDEGSPVVNMMSISAKDQVMLEVRIVEMQRTVVKQLGINLSGAMDFGELANQVERQLFTFDPVTGAFTDSGTTALEPGLPYSNRFRLSSANSFNVAGSSLGGLSTELGYTNYNGTDFQSSAGAAIDALERVGIVRTLAEPNIMAVSGEAARFLAGGEYPVPVSQNEDGSIGVEFKQYGVALAFTPVVLSEGRISLKISTEISELSNVGAFQGESIAGITATGDVITAQTLTIPALIVRRAESTVELPSGGSTMLAGLIQSQSKQTLDQLPGLKKLPILGALFQSRDFVNEETEMVVIVTPYLVDPTKKEELRTPVDGYVNASDPNTIFFGRLNAVYAEPGKEISPETYQAPVG
ncbi:MAG: type II and III secretion system protein family protein, partial [Pseudomonadota bacterium]